MAEHLEACAEWRDDLAAWVVAQISPAREALLDAHLAGCRNCRAEADDLLGVAAVALVADPDASTQHPAERGEPAPPLLADRIVARVRSERHARFLRRCAIAAVGSAAAAAVLVVALAVVPEADPARLRGEEFAFRRVPSGASAEVVVADDDGASVVELVATGLDPRTTYALWLTPPGGGYPERVAAGTFRPDEDGQVDVRLRSAIDSDKVGRVWVTGPDGIVIDTEPA